MEITRILAVVFAAHIAVKFCFFALPYARRREQLDRSYGRALTATRRSDPVLLVVVLALAGTLFAVGGEAPSFVIGLWCGATLIQLYFHQFHEPLDDRTAPAPPVGPIKLMSYAIQAKPWAPWPEIVALIVLAGGAFVFLAW